VRVPKLAFVVALKAAAIGCRDSGSLFAKKSEPPPSANSLRSLVVAAGHSADGYGAWGDMDAKRGEMYLRSGHPDRVRQIQLRDE